MPARQKIFTIVSKCGKQFVIDDLPRFCDQQQLIPHRLRDTYYNKKGRNNKVRWHGNYRVINTSSNPQRRSSAPRHRRQGTGRYAGGEEQYKQLSYGYQLTRIRQEEHELLEQCRAFAIVKEYNDE